MPEIAIKDCHNIAGCGFYCVNKVRAGAVSIHAVAVVGIGEAAERLHLSVLVN